MPLYDESDDQFRAAPSGIALGITSFSVFVVTTVMAQVMVACADLALAVRAGLRSPLQIYAPLAGAVNGFWSSPPLHRSYGFAPVVLIAGSLVLTILIIHFWPTEQHLATRVFSQGLAASVVIWGCLYPACRPASFVELADSTDLPPIAWCGVFAAVGLIASMWVERRSVELMTNFYTLWKPGQRLRRWLVRIPLAVLALAALSALGGNLAGCLALLTYLVATLIENLSRVPKQRFERLGNPFLREAAATFPVLAILLVAGSAITFGIPGTGGVATSVVLDDGRVKIRSALAVKAQFPETLDPRLRREGPRPGEPVPPLELRWSKDRGKKDAGVKVQPRKE